MDGRVLTALGGASTEGIQLIVKTDTGSTVYIENENNEIVNTDEVNGLWYFSDLEPGDWTITCTLETEIAIDFVTITDNESCQIVEVSYGLRPSDFTVYLGGTNTPATLGTDYEVVNDADEPIAQELWPSAKNWKFRCLVNVDVVPLRDGEIDVFLVGGGGDAGSSRSYGGGSGGGGGCTKTVKSVEIRSETRYALTIGVRSSDTTGFGETASGGTSGNIKGYPGGSGGSGGGGGFGDAAWSGGEGGSDGSDGVTTNESQSPAGTGQGTTTREFGELTGRLYAGGGAGGSREKVISGGAGGGGDSGQDGAPNTGGGGGGPYINAASSDDYGLGGSGIVVFRNTRTVT